MTRHGIQAALHYLDDYIFFGTPDTSECAEALKLALQLCEQLGVPVSKLKAEGPATILAFLVIVLDTVAMELRLPEERQISNTAVENQAVLHQEGIIITHRSAPTCLPGSAPWQNLPQTYDHLIYMYISKGATSSRASKCCIQINLQISYSLDDPFAGVALPQLDLVMWGIKRAEAEKGVKERAVTFRPYP